MKRSPLKDQTGSTVLFVVLTLVVVSVVGLAAWRISSRKQAESPKTTSPAPTSSESQTAKPLSAGSDDDSLNKDLANINASLNEGNQNLQSAINATGDESQFVNVPTD